MNLTPPLSPVFTLADKGGAEETADQRSIRSAVDRLVGRRVVGALPPSRPRCTPSSWRVGFPDPRAPCAAAPASTARAAARLADGPRHLAALEIHRLSRRRSSLRRVGARPVRLADRSVLDAFVR